MPEYRQLGLFDKFIEDEDEANTVDEYMKYTLIEDETDIKDGKILYKIFDDFGILVDKFRYSENALDMPMPEYKKSQLRRSFLSKVIALRTDRHKVNTPDSPKEDKIDSFDKNQMKLDLGPEKHEIPKRTYSYSNSYGNWGYGNFSALKTGYVEKYCNSDTLVFHKADPSTTMLSQVYDGKGWDVITDTYIDPKEIRELIEKHERIIFLGHGTPGGLIGGNMTPQLAPSLKGKKVFAIWCYAATFFKRNGLTGQGIFCTDNCPSEVAELQWAGIHDKVYTAQYVLENITYYCKLCADVVEQALNGDPEGAVKYVREKYIEKFGHDGMTDFNANTLQVV